MESEGDAEAQESGDVMEILSSMYLYCFNVALFALYAYSLIFCLFL